MNQPVVQEDNFVYTSPLGDLRIRMKNGILCEIHFPEEGETLESRLPKSEAGQQVADALSEYFSGKLMHFQIPFQQEGTPFQQQVWSQLVTIPYGNTISYMELARRLGNPKSIRAAGTANGRNALPIVVPCHRVIGSGGSLVGFSGGLARKQWLLEHEARFRHGVQTLF